MEVLDVGGRRSCKPGSAPLNISAQDFQLRLLRIEIKTGPGQTGPARQARDILRSRAPCTKADDLWSLVAI
ncbi:unnamed protein product [Gadus morhua 'NCC']